MRKFLFVVIQIVICVCNLSAQSYDDLFVTYKPVYTPSTPVYVRPSPTIIDNSVTIIGNSYRPSAPSIRCTDSQTYSGQILMIDCSSNKDSVVDADVLFKSFSDNTASVTITRLKLDGKWYPTDIDVTKLSSILDSSTGENRTTLLKLMKDFTFIASAEDIFFLF